VLANWRDWNIPVKLAAVTLVPVVFAVVLGTMQISDQVDKASSYRRVDRLVGVNEELRGLVGALQTERGAAGTLLAARAPDVVARLAGQRRATDTARAAFLRAAGRVTLDHDAAAARYRDVLRWLDELSVVREQVAAPGFAAANAVTRYSAIVDALLRFDRTMTAEAIDPTLASTAVALHDLEQIKEEVSYQQAVIAVGVVRRGLSGPELEALAASVGRQADRLSDFYSVAGAERGRLYDTTVVGTGIAARNNVVAAVVANPPGVPLPTTAQDWQDASTLTADRIDDVARALARDLHDRSTALQDEASDGAGLAAVILLVAMVVAIAVMFVVGKHLLSSLAALRRGALDVAERALPDAVARIRDRGEHAGGIHLPPVPVTAMDEVGQVARAFDAVQRQALKLATEQAGLRATYSSVFVNLSRRSQGLVQRQLQLLDRLERDEEDGDQLATLFQLDHLATRMRRNNENLMVLSGNEVGRRAQRPTSLADLLRASVSEIEQYQRVVLLPPPSVQVVGYAVGDLVRLVAELLDNATAFSAPDTQVTLASHSFEDGSLCVVVIDEGIGMSQAELDEANAKLADPGLIDVAASRRMGLFVIGRLAGRHGIEVRLGSGQDVTGVRATVTVPAEVIVQTGEPVEPERVRTAAPNGTSLLAPFSPGGVTRATSHTNGTNGHANGHANGVNGFAPTPFPRRSLTDTEAPGPATPAGEPAETTAEPEDAGTGKAPLPRRSPGGRMPAPRTATQDPARPRGPFEPPASTDASDSGNQGGSGWWTANTPDRTAVEETTPIFDEMVSAWFRAVSDPAVDDATAAAMKPHPPETRQGGAAAWNFAADSGFDAARAALNTEPSDFTSGGLPRRSPRQHLVPGSATATPDGAPRPTRAPDDVRTRLSEYRQGIRRARDHTPDTPAQPPGTAPLPGTAPSPDAAPLTGATPAAGVAPTSGAAPLPGAAPGPAAAPGSGTAPLPGTTPISGTVPLPGATPGSGTVPVSGVVAGSGTAALPGAAQSRDAAPLTGATPGSGAGPVSGTAALSGAAPLSGAVPGSAGAASPGGVPLSGDASGSGAAPGSAVAPTPGAVPGSGSAPLPGAAPLSGAAPGSAAAPASGTAPFSGAAPGSAAAPQLAPASTPDSPAGDDTADTADTAQLNLSGAGWRFAADIGWRAAGEASAANPVAFTSGGLPRRSPRQNLVPGSVSHNGDAAVPPRAERAEEMRGRLGNFQKGLSRGRRSLADRATAHGFHDHTQQQESE
jgi:signal transduction histidine kinase